MHTIIIYGPGCARCEELELRTRQAVNALSGQYDVRHERDAAAMAAAGILATPALEMDGTLLFSGKVPSLRELQQLLAAASDGSPVSRETAPCACQSSASACGCGCKEHSSASAPTCCCGGGKSDHSGSRLAKKLLLWAAVVLTAVGVIKYVNHRQKLTAEPPRTSLLQTPVPPASGK